MRRMPPSAICYATTTYIAGSHGKVKFVLVPVSAGGGLQSRVRMVTSGYLPYT
jgi:hypothetical protein